MAKAAMFGILIAMLVVQVISKSSLKIISMSVNDLGTTTKHACSKRAFTDCEDTFKRHVEAVAAYRDEKDDKQDLWCEVLQSHKTCMDEVLDDCLADHPILGHKIQTYLTDVVHKGCTHEGQPITNGCVKKLRAKRNVEGGKTLYDMANDCLKANSIVDPTLKNLMKLLKDLTKSIKHMYKRLPQD